MSEQFKVNEVAIGQNFVNRSKYNGVECEIIGGLELHTCIRPNGEVHTVMRYLVAWADGVVAAVAHCHLRRRKSPATGEASILALFKGTPQRQKEPA